MPRAVDVYLADILDAVAQIRSYVEGMDDTAFSRDRKTLDAVLRNLEVIGEAARHVPARLRAETPEIDWKRVVAFRNVLAHEYFGVSVPIVWDIVQTKLGPLHATCARLLDGFSIVAHEDQKKLL